MLHGRERERREIAALIDEAWTARGGALVLRGEPGVGKSVLLDDAVAGGEGMRVLRTQGIESESPLAFAALHRFLRPVLDHVERLPAPQARALRAAFGQSDDEGIDRFLVFLGALSLLAEAAEDGPVLGIVDDAQWLDDASAAALLFIARRLQVERIALLFGVREDDTRGFAGGDLPQLRVQGLDRDAAAALLTERAGVPVSAEVCDRLMGTTGGNPLALVEMPDVLTTDQLGGSTRLPARLPVTEGVERVFLDRSRHLSAQAQTLLLVAAADDSGQLSTIRRAAGLLGAGDDAMEAVERSGLLRVSGAGVELRHPLVRSALYSAATSSERRRVHGALAEVMVHHDDADRRAWHRAAAADAPDGPVVEELDEVAERARQRGGHEAASAAWERAAELTSQSEARGARIYAAARSAWLAGQPTRARLLADEAVATLCEPGLRSDAARLRARIEWNTGSVRLGHRMVMQAARDVVDTDPERAREMAMFGAALATFGGASDIGIDPTELIPDGEEPTAPRARCFTAMLLGLNHLANDELAKAAPLLREALELGDAIGDTDLLPNLGIAALQMGHDEASTRIHTLLESRARESGALVMVLYSLTRRGITEIATGQWNRARANTSEALHLAEGMDQPGLTAMPLSFLALLTAFRGDAASEEHVAAWEQVTATHATGIVESLTQDMIRWAKGLREPHAASSYLELSRISHPITRTMAAIDRIEAALRAEEPDQALAWADELERYATATEMSWALAAAAHGRAVLSDGAEAEEHFERALAHHASSQRRFDVARTELAYGEFLRRARRRVDARAHLRRALQIFDELEAVRWSERAGQELRASGETARKRDPSTAGQLTPQEQQVARLVQDGLSNRDVAAQLFVSPRTVDFHLRNVFAKLGLTSRSELARLSLG